MQVLSFEHKDSMLIIYKPMGVFCALVRLFKRLLRVEGLIAYVIVRLLRVSDLCTRSDLCVQRTALRVERLIDYD